MGSSAHDLVGDCIINWRTSSSLHGDSVGSDASVTEVVAGGLRPFVAARTALILSSKNRMKGLASLHVGVTSSDGRLSRWSSDVKERQSFVGESPSVVIRSD